MYDEFVQRLSDNVRNRMVEVYRGDHFDRFYRDWVDLALARMTHEYLDDEGLYFANPVYHR